MKLFKFASSESDWIAADTQEHAVEIYMRDYGLAASDMQDVEVSEVDPNEVEVFPDGWDYEDDEAEPPSAAEIMETMKCPGLVCSTNN
jgi:hypothetical protein